MYVGDPFHTSLGQLDLLYKIAGAGRSQQNSCRNLHSLIHKVGLTLPLRIHTVEIPVRKKKPKLKKVWVHYPVILPTTWVSYLLKFHSRMILGGSKLENVDSWKRGLLSFWDTYLKTDPTHPMNFGGPPKEATIPLYLHGDEGRGKCRLPLMVQCIQPCISFKGPGFKNSSGSPVLFFGGKHFHIYPRQRDVKVKGICFKTLGSKAKKVDKHKLLAKAFTVYQVPLYSFAI